MLLVCIRGELKGVLFMQMLEENTRYYVKMP